MSAICAGLETGRVGFMFGYSDFLGMGFSIDNAEDGVCFLGGGSRGFEDIDLLM